MKLTNQTLRQIIKEELQLVLNESPLYPTHPGDSEMIADMKKAYYLAREYDSLHNEYNSMAEEQHEIYEKIVEISDKYYILALDPVGERNIKAIEQGRAFSIYDVDSAIAVLRYYPTDPRLGFGGNKNISQRQYFTPENLQI